MFPIYIFKKIHIYQFFDIDISISMGNQLIYVHLQVLLWFLLLGCCAGQDSYENEVSVHSDLSIVVLELQFGILTENEKAYVLKLEQLGPL